MGAYNLVKAKKQDVQKNESIDSYAKNNGMSWQELAKFNWGTSDPDKINKILKEIIGCMHLTNDKKNYLFWGDEKQNGGTGYIWIPMDLPATTYATNNTHVIKIKLPLVDFIEHNTQYGFDNFTNVGTPWKSVEKGMSDSVQARISPACLFTHVDFNDSDTLKNTVLPIKAISGAQDLSLTGIDNGEAEVKANYSGSPLATLKVKTYTKKIKTVAVRLVHEVNYTSTDISNDKIESFLKKVYKQAVFEFTLTRLPAMTVPFDINNDGKVDVDSWMSPEMRKIRDACKDDSYDFNIFLVDNPSDGSTGFMDFNQRYGFVHSGNSGRPESTFAHEIGHGGFGLVHTPGDDENIMYNYTSITKWRLRKNQWDIINP